MKSWVVGADLGGTKIRLGLVGPDDRIVAVRQIPTRAEAGPADVVARIGDAVDELARTMPADGKIVGMGICSPGPVDHETGTIIDPPNIQGLHHTPLRQLLEERLGVPVALEHDAKAAALGDYYFGAGRGERSMVYIVVGTGVGAAIILDGQLYRGAHNSAGEIGHTTLDRHGDRCSCGSRGCVETYLSGPWLARRYVDLLAAAGPDEAQPWGDNALSGEDVAQRAATGDATAQAVLAGAGSALGAAVATLAMVLDVDHFVIGGSVAKAGELLLEPARRTVPLYSFSSVSQRVRVVPTALGDDGPILGCAWLARQG